MPICGTPLTDGFMEHIQPYLDYFAANPGWAIAVVFLIAMGEALLIIGLFVPSTAVLVGAGMLVGTGHLGFWPVFIATTVGAFVGDQVSFWAGRLFGERLRTMWPLSKYPALVAKGEAFVREHGGKSIAVGRFVPGVKAVVPGIVGMLGMNQIFFLSVNVASSIVWAAAHVVPGVLLGQGLALAGELSGRLLMVLLVLLLLIAVGGWLIRLVSAGISPYLNHVLHNVSVWARSRGSRPLHRFGRAIAPGNPRGIPVLLFLVIAVGCLFALADLVSGLVVRDAVSNLDLSLATLMGEWRNAPADELMVTLAMLADRPVLWAVGGCMVLWLFMWRAWRAALVALAILASGELLSVGLGTLVGRAPPVLGISASDGTFPSGHVLMAGLVFGLLAVLASHAMGRWSKAVVAAMCGSLVVAVGFSRVYLGADWMSSVLGGVLVAAVLSAVFGMLIEAIPSRRIRPLGLMGLATLVFLAAGALHIKTDFAKAQVAYAKPVKMMTFDEAKWTGGAWAAMPGRRIDLAGQPEEVFAAQWMGELPPLEQALKEQGWQPVAMWTWRDALSYLDPHAQLAALPPRPLLHQGLKAKLTLLRAFPGDAHKRQVLRIYKTFAEVKSPDATRPVYVMSLLVETIRPHLGLYDVPATLKSDPSDVSGLVQALGQTSSLKSVAQGTDSEKPLAVFQANM